ncbi:glycoside hydrolase family protein [Oxalobacter paraformigenes]|uniref:Lysozyme n=1 Tax=Oxalobacter paraformigenes TaxID=556268 RepID=C3X1U7_9BURK|nr:glycoside hydrolase family protein [Oxalobacter paraformigenes]EEO27183.1 hypothetical protein OFAG_00336 [Oxalobacter paraformigenes]
MDVEELVINIRVDDGNAPQKLEQIDKELNQLKAKAKAIKDAGKDVADASKKIGEDAAKAGKGISGASKEIDANSKKFKEFQKSIKGVRDTFMSLRSVFAMGLGAIAFDKLMNLNRENIGIGNTALIAGEDVRKVAGLRNMAARAGFDESEGDNLFRNVRSRVDAARNGSPESLFQLQAYGVDVYDKLRGDFRTAEEIISTLGESVLDYEKRRGGTLQDAIGTLKQLGLTEAQAILVTQENFQKRWDLAQKEAVINEKTVESSRKAIESLQRLKETAKVVFGGFLEIINPVLEAISTFLSVPGRSEPPAKKAPPGGYEDGYGITDWLTDLFKDGAKTVVPEAKASVPETKISAVPSSIQSVPTSSGNIKMTGGTLRDTIRENLMEREGVRLKAYQDSKGLWTIGYGHTKGVKPGMTITKDQAAKLLEQDMKDHVDVALKMYAGSSEKTRMLAADLAYNAGLKAIQKGTQFAKLAEQGEISRSDYTKLYNYSGGKFIPGLVNRRKATYDMASAYQDMQATKIVNNQNTTTNNVTNNIKVSSTKEAAEVARQLPKQTLGSRANSGIAA